MTQTITAPEATAPTRIGNYRWTICALLFFATTVNYVDRQVLGVLAEHLTEKIHWSEAQYGHIVMAFQAAYALGMALTGYVIDRLGLRWGFALTLTLWSLAAMAHGLARTALGFGVARFALGLSEAGNFPACVKAVAQWFPRKERALATGIFNAGSNIGAVVAPATVPFIAIWWGWQYAFILTGAIGLAWLIFWLAIYAPPQKHPRVGPEELAHIQSDPPEPETKIPWLELLPHRQTLAFALGKFLTDPVWWFYLFWVTKFLAKNYDVKLAGVALPLMIIYLMADVGSIAGGWLSSSLLKRGWSANAARKTAMLACALSVLPVLGATRVSNMWVAVALFSLATAAHQGWSCNLFTTVSDMFPRRAVGSVVGLGGMCGAIGGIIMAESTGRILQVHDTYWPLFVYAALAYLVALAVIHALVPRMEPAKGL